MNLLINTILLLTSLAFSYSEAEICLICKCAFVNISKVEPKPGDFITFQYKADIMESFNINKTYDSTKKYFYVDCSDENNVGQINNLDWPKVNVLGILANFRSSKWKKLESFPESIKKQMAVLSLAQNLITEIDDFELDDFVNLKMLNLSLNQIETIQKGVFGKLSLLKILDLSKNWLTKLEDWAFYGTNIQYLNLSRNGLTHISPDVFRGLNNLTVLDLSDNKLIKLPDEFSNYLLSLTWLSLKKNSFPKLPDLPKKLERLDVSYNQLLDFHLVHSNLNFLDIRYNEILSLSHTNLPELRVLLASHNNLTILTELQSGKIRILDLSYNKFERIPELIHSDKLPFVEELYLDGNPLKNVTFPSQTESFSALRVLSLSHLKYVTKILKHTFEGVFPRVKYDCQKESGVLIDLSHNSIKFIDEDAFKMVSVCRIDLSKNNLKFLSKDLLPWISMSYINLQDNPWQCDCNIQWMLDDFLTFMYENNPRELFGMRCSTPLRYKNKLFVFWYNKSENVFCNSGPSAFYIDLAGGKKIEIWTASAIACVILGCIILLIGIIIIVLLCTKPSKKKKHSTRSNSKGPPYYKQIQNNSIDKNDRLSEKYV